MTVTAASLIAEFPEFDLDGSNTAIIQAKIDAATLRTDATVWGTMRDEGIKYLAAHLLALSPFARELKLANDNGETIYGKMRRDMEMVVASGFRVTGITEDV